MTPELTNMHDKIEHNLRTAAEAALYYDDVWSNCQTGQKYEGYALGRIQFVEKAMTRFVRRRDLEILDLGCGSGWLSDYLSAWGSVTGTDFAPKTLEAARSHFGQRVHFVLADTESPTLNIPPDRRFDVVVCSEVIEHVTYPEAIVAQISGFLKPQGWCILTTPNGKLWPQYVKDKRYQHFHQPIENWLTPEACAELLQAFNFSIQVHEGWSAPYFQYTLLSRVLIRRSIDIPVRWLGLHDLYARLTLPFSIFQLILARKS